MTKRISHTLADHRLGNMADHLHDPDADYDHEHDEDPRHDLVEPGSVELEAPAFLSIGIDIGSATTQIAFSRLRMHGAGEPASLRRLIRSSETLWLSPVALTPWRGDSIDVAALRRIVDAAFEGAGLHPDDIDSGVAIMTGDAAADPEIRSRLLDPLAEELGDLVAAAAGHSMEATLAAWGSGAVRCSLAAGLDLVLLDIGGATTKLAAIEAGRVTRVAALGIGTRLATFEKLDDRPRPRVVKLARAAAELVRRAGAAWTLGAEVEEDEIELVGAALADAILKAMADPLDAAFTDLWLTEPFRPVAPNEVVMLSGGASEYAFGRETRTFGDFGPAMGRRLLESSGRHAPAFRWAAESAGIRATVLGAAEHNLQISGETSFISSPARLLPKRNLPVAAPNFSFVGAIDPRPLAEAIVQKRKMLNLDGPDPEFALALRWRGDPDYERLSACARGVADGLSDRIRAEKPLFLILEGDCALLLARLLRDEFGVNSDMIALDGIVLRELDWIDIGRLRLPSNTVPVTVKSLLFGEKSPARRPRASEYDRP